MWYLKLMSKKYPRYVNLDMSAKIAYMCIIKYKKNGNHFYEIMHQNRQCRQIGKIAMKKLHSITIHSYLFQFWFFRFS